MFKKLLIASAVLAVSSSVAFAAAPYVGVGLGVNDTQTKISNSDSSIKNFGARGALLNVFGGYGGLVASNIYLAGELLFNATGTQAKATGGDGDYTKLTMKNTWGISFIPGVMLSDRTMIFGRLGVVKTGFNAKSVDVIDGAATSNSTTKTLTGGQLGLGMQANVAQNIDVRGEYVYTSYRSFKVSGTKFSPSSDLFNLAVLYKFD